MYVIEMYLERSAPTGLDVRERRLRRAADELTRSGSAVRFIELLHVPEDELCLARLEAPSQEVVGAAAARAGLEPLRIVWVLPTVGGTPAT